MQLKILRIQSDELDPRDSGLPPDAASFDVELEIELCVEGHEADSAFFRLFVASPAGLTARESGAFMPPTLLLSEFSWPEIWNRVAKLLLYARGSKDWNTAIVKMGGHIQPIA